MKILPKNIGILSYLGPYPQHRKIFEEMRVYTSEVKTLEDLNGVDALVIPGTEITPLLIALEELLGTIKIRAKEGMPLLLTGEACLLLDEQIKTPLSAKKMHIVPYNPNNSRQYTENVHFHVSDTRLFEAFFLRSPKIQKLPKNWGVLSEKSSDGDEPILIEEDAILACTFYPELGNDIRIHEYFLSKI